MLDISKIVGGREYENKKEKVKDNIEREVYSVREKVFLVINKNTIEVRTDGRLGKLLVEKYESVMRSRYFGKGGIEIVNSGQLKEAELEDLIRLSYNLTLELE